MPKCSIIHKYILQEKRTNNIFFYLIRGDLQVKEPLILNYGLIKQEVDVFIQICDLKFQQRHSLFDSRILQNFLKTIKIISLLSEFFCRWANLAGNKERINRMNVCMYESLDEKLLENKYI